MSITILAIETSCDDTAISILRAKNGAFEVLANEVSSQTELHAQWGGVVPNLAAREHQKNIFPMLSLALENAGVLPSKIDLIAMTQGPGLIPALLVGTSAAKTLSYLWGKPLIGIHHVEGHIYANFVFDKISINSNDQLSTRLPDGQVSKQIPKTNSQISNEIKNLTDNKSYKLKASEANIEFPALCLVVSGGHTQLVFMKNHLQYEIIGQTLDDAAGEAFDKVARILNIGYPGGPAVAQHASKFQDTRSKNQTIFPNQNSISKQNLHDIRFPRPMLNKNNFDFSFSGLKTAVLYETKKHPNLLKDEGYISEVCNEFQQATIDVLVSKTIKAAQEYEAKTIMLAGGVSANKELRKQLGEAIENNLPQTTYNLPQLALTGDNAAMIAAAAAFRWQSMGGAEKEATKNNWKTLIPDANLKLQ